MSRTFRISIVLLILLVILLFAILFRTEGVTVSGNIHVSEDTVRELIMENPVSFHTLLTMGYAVFRPFEDGNFIDRIELNLEKPSILHATVREKELTAYFMKDGQNWYFDETGTIQAVSAEAENELDPDRPYLPCIQNLEIGSPAIGGILAEPSAGWFGELAHLLRLMDTGGVRADLVSLTEEHDVILYYGNVKVIFGSPENPELRLSRMTQILPETEEMSGTLDLADVTGSTEGILFRKDS